MPLLPIKTRLEKIFKLTPTVWTFRFRFPEGKWVPFKAGQFCMVHIPEVCDIKIPKEGRTIKRAYSIASAPFEEGYLDLCVKKVEQGPGTSWLFQLQEGAEVTVTIPYGNFLMKEPINYDFVFVATGTGIAPLRSMIQTLYHDRLLPDGKQIMLIFGVRYEDEILYDEEWRGLEKEYSNFKFIPTISRPKNWTGETGYVQEKLKKYVTDPQGKEIYICGLGAMVKAVQKTAQEIGFKKERVNFERYD